MKNEIVSSDVCCIEVRCNSNCI